MANGRSIGLIIIINIIYAKLDCHIIIATKTKYRTGLNAGPDMIIHLTLTATLSPPGPLEIGPEFLLTTI